MRFTVLGIAWLLAVIAAGAAGLPASLHPPAPQLVLIGLTLALLVLWRASPSFGSWVSSLPWSSLVALHLTRFVGIYFLWSYANALLPYDFAVPGGIGDIIVAFGALAILLKRELVSRNPKLLLLWNIAGLIDIVFVVCTAARLAIADPVSMAYLLKLPLCILPTYLVPLIIASHVVLFNRLRTTSRLA